MKSKTVYVITTTTLDKSVEFLECFKRYNQIMESGNVMLRLQKENADCNFRILKVEVSEL